MRSLRLFLSIFLLSLWVMLFGAFLFMVMFESRGGGVTMPMAGVAIRPETGFAAIDLPNRIFTCTQTTEQQQQCQADIQGHPLVLTLEKPVEDPGAGIYDDCQAQYDGRSIRCENVGDEYAPMLSPSLEVTGLASSPQEFQHMRQKYWITQTMLKAGEPRLLRISGGLSLVGGAIAACFAWFHPNWFSKGLATIVVGFLTSWLAVILLAQMFYSFVTSHGVTNEAWTLMVSFGAIAAGIGAAIAVGWRLWRRSQPAIKLAVALSSGVGTLCVFKYVSLMLLCGSGFVD